LTHMAEEEKAEAAAWLRERGYRIVSSTRVANLALVGEGVAKNELRQISAMTGKAMTLRELKASRPSETAAVTVVAPPVREPDPEPFFVEDEDSV
ncbi:MAG: hypothetical protein JHC85_05500, partial [Chthoniobacterales bacterium]|nr:hypothetical protein [Chthoniobacterales bacterium]